MRDDFVEGTSQLSVDAQRRPRRGVADDGTLSSILFLCYMPARARLIGQSSVGVTAAASYDECTSYGHAIPTRRRKPHCRSMACAMPKHMMRAVSRLPLLCGKSGGRAPFYFE